MVQISQPWNDRVIGDAVRAPYTASEWDDMFEGMFNSDGDYGVLVNRGNELEGSIPGANQFRIATGEALVKGKWYENDANVDFAPVSATAGNWRRDRIVLSSSWNAINDATRDPAIQDAQTIRLIRLINPAENAVAPAITQTDGTLWEIPLYQINISDAGVVTIWIDERQFVGGAGQSIRTNFIPMIMAWNNTDGTVIVPTAAYLKGWEFVDNKLCSGVGFGVLPSDFDSVAEIRAVVIPGSVGNDVYARIEASYAYCADDYQHFFLPWGYSPVTLASSAYQYCIGDLTLNPASEAKHQILRLEFKRDATNVLDTQGASVWVIGFILTYKAEG